MPAIKKQWTRTDEVQRVKDKNRSANLSFVIWPCSNNNKTSLQLTTYITVWLTIAIGYSWITYVNVSRADVYDALLFTTKGGENILKTFDANT